MNTPAHVIFGAAAFAPPGAPRVTLAAIAGSLAPDLSLYLMVGVSIWLFRVEPMVVFGEYYYSAAWQQVFAVDNSFLLWGGMLGLGIRFRHRVLIAFAGAGFLHLAFDFPLHNHDARRHFWPLTDWVFESPLNYWDWRFHADIVGPLEVALSLVLCVLLWRRFRRLPMRAGVALLAAAEAMASGVWQFIF
ncbi:MAG: cobalamin biosynthesis protein CobQ [Rhodobacteraceae bacterium]|nr:cobalamin biosynthesis protein CobQ [Paracoccaceae bacterium]